MRPTFHDARAKLQRIRDEARSVAGSEALKDVSDVKRDGNVIVKFRSVPGQDAMTTFFEFIDRAAHLGWPCVYTADDPQCKLHIDDVKV